MAGLTLSLLGSFQATLDGKTIAGFESDRVRALLAYLAVECDRPHRRETLTGLLWPDWPDTSALTNLRNSLANLRKAIGDREAAVPAISANRETLQFNISGSSWVDVHTFRMLTAPDQPIERLEEGIALYRGPFLEGFGLKDSPLFDEWQQRVRDQLLRQCLSALERVSDHHQQSGNLEKAIAAALKQVDLAPWQEEAHRRLMSLLALNGQRSAALTQYETCCHLLQKELGVEVSPETTLLYQQILNGELATQSETPDSSKTPAQLFNSPELPTWQIPFVGRRTLLGEIQERLQDPDCRLLTLLGPGGSGKTRLAAETAVRQAQAFPDGVYFALLAGLQPGASIVPAVARALGFKPREGGDPQQQVLDYLRNKNLLLALDNFEHLLAQAAFVAEILRAAPRVKILVTSQVRLNLSGEHLLPVSGMSVPEQPPASLADALRHSSFHLFVEGAQRVAPAFSPTLADLEQIQHICRLVQGSPLAILLAAAWMGLLAPAEIAAEIEAHSLDFLESEWQDIPERQRSLRAVFDYSWWLLSERERQVLAGLTVFRGDFSYPAAQQVCGASLRDLMKLVNHSLLERTSEGRYRLHELVRQYGEEKLLELPDQGQSLHDRHTSFYTSALKTWAVKLKGPSQLDAISEMDLEIDNIRSAWGWAVERCQVEQLAEGWEGLVHFYLWRSHLSENGLLFQQAVDMLEANASNFFPKWLGLWVMFRSAKDYYFSKLTRDEHYKERLTRDMVLLEQATQAGQDVRRYKAYLLGIVPRFFTGEYDEARRVMSASTALFKELNDPWGEARGLRGEGEFAQAWGNYLEAELNYRSSLALHLKFGGPMEIVETQVVLSGVLTRLNRTEEADTLLSACIAAYRRLGDPAGLARALYTLAANFKIKGMYRDALEGYAECIQIYEMFGNHGMLARVFMHQGTVKLTLGEYDQARVILQKSYLLFQEIKEDWGLGRVKCLLGELALAAGRWAEARQLLQESIPIGLRENSFGWLGQANTALGIAELRLNDPENARLRMAEALRLTQETHEFEAAVYIFLGTFLLWVEEGKLERSAELHALAARYPYFTNSVYFQDLLRQPLAALSNTLPPEVAAAAEQRGRQRDLWATINELLGEFGEDPH